MLVKKKELLEKQNKIQLLFNQDTSRLRASDTCYLVGGEGRFLIILSLS